MSRWRPPSPAASAYITEAGYACLKAEEKALWKKRKEVNAALSAAAAEGDRSENAEYIYRKKQQAELDRRIRYLQKRLPDLQIVKTVANTHQVFFGAWITILDEEDQSQTFRIVGPDEADYKKKSISVDSPLARAVLKKQVGDEVVVKTQQATTTYEITQIRY